MHVERIDLFVVGLPVSTYAQRRQQLQRMLEGEHDLAGDRRVRVQEVWVFAQPHGTLVAHAKDSGRIEQLQRQRTLVIDCGSRTFDWLLAQGFKVIDEKSHSVNRGMLHVLHAIADEISNDLFERYNDLERIDRALRLNEPLIVAGKKYPLQPHIKAAQHIPIQAVQELRNHLDVQDASSATIDNIVLSGGGAFFFEEAVAKAFPRHEIRVLKSSMYSNVRGFQIVGMDGLQRREAARATAAKTDSRVA
jgi:plasmid segregation protein ParM